MCDAQGLAYRRWLASFMDTARRNAREYREHVKPPLGQRARRDVAVPRVSREDSGLSQHYVGHATLVILDDPPYAEWVRATRPYKLGRLYEGVVTLLRGGSTARRRVWLGVLKAVQREVKDG